MGTRTCRRSLGPFAWCPGSRQDIQVVCRLHISCCISLKEAKIGRLIYPCCADQYCRGVQRRPTDRTCLCYYGKDGDCHLLLAGYLFVWPVPVAVFTLLEAIWPPVGVRRDGFHDEDVAISHDSQPCSDHVRLQHPHYRVPESTRRPTDGQELHLQRQAAHRTQHVERAPKFHPAVQAMRLNLFAKGKEAPTGKHSAAVGVGVAARIWRDESTAEKHADSGARRGGGGGPRRYDRGPKGFVVVQEVVLALYRQASSLKQKNSLA